jgi:hypothetical protein
VACPKSKHFGRLCREQKYLTILLVSTPILLASKSVLSEPIEKPQILKLIAIAF